jgi:hypothetical protein
MSIKPSRFGEITYFAERLRLTLEGEIYKYKSDPRKLQL